MLGLKVNKNGEILCLVLESILYLEGKAGI